MRMEIIVISSSEPCNASGIPSETIEHLVDRVGGQGQALSLRYLSLKIDIAEYGSSHIAQGQTQRGKRDRVPRRMHSGLHLVLCLRSQYFLVPLSIISLLVHLLVQNFPSFL